MEVEFRMGHTLDETTLIFICCPYHICTVNSEIFARVLFSRNFACAKLRKVKSSRNGYITLSTTDIGKSYPSSEIFRSQICLLTIFAKKNRENFRINSIPCHIG